MAEELPPKDPDPTKNVGDLVDAESKRTDGLRIAEQKFWEAQFEWIRRELDTSEDRRIEQKEADSTALGAALAAAKELVNAHAAAAKEAIVKSETNVAEQARQQASTFAAQIAGLTAILADVKERVDKIQSLKEGGEEHKTDQRANIGTIAAIAAVLFGLVTFIGGIMMILASANGAGR